MSNVKVVMTPGVVGEKKEAGRGIRVERKSKFESLVNGGGERSEHFIIAPSAREEVLTGN